MPLESILYVGFVISAFVVFAAVLTYAEWATRHANDNVSKPAQVTRAKPLYHEETVIRRAA